MKTQLKFIFKRKLKILISSLLFACSYLEAQATGSLWGSKKSGEYSMFADRIARRVGQQLEIIITDQGKFTYDLNTTISDKLQINDGVTQWLFPVNDSTFGTYRSTPAADGSAATYKRSTPNVIANANDSNTGQWKIENTQKFEKYRFSADIVDDLGNDILVISGKRKITAGQETYYLRIVGKIRTDDIHFDNTIESTKISNATFEIISEGQLSEGQQGGWLEQIYMRGIHPF